MCHTVCLLRHNLTGPESKHHATLQAGLPAGIEPCQLRFMLVAERLLTWGVLWGPVAAPGFDHRRDDTGVAAIHLINRGM